MSYDNTNNNNITIESKRPIVTNQFSPKNNGLSITSLTLGIISLISCWIFLVPIITGIIGAITGCISLLRKRDGTNIAIAGIVTSILALLLGALFFAIYIL